MNEDSRREAVEYRGRRVPGLLRRRRSSGLVFEARVRVDGEVRRKTFGATTVVEAVAELERFKADLRRCDASVQTARTAVTLADVYELYLERLHQDKRTATTTANAQQRYRHLERLHGKPIAAITRGDAAGLIRELRRKGLAGSSVRSIVATASAIMNIAVESELASSNPFALVRRSLPAANKGAKRSLSPEDVHRLLDAATPKQGALLALLGLSGLRVSEACGALWDDVDFERGVLRVRAQLGPDGKRAPLKTASSQRTLELDPRALELLRRWKAEQLRLGQHRADNFVLATVTGRPLRRRQAHRMVQGTARRTGLIGKGEAFRLHDLRAAYAVASLRNGDAVNVVQKALGHSSSAMTVGLYGKLLSDRPVGTSAFARPEAEVVPLQSVGS